MLKDNQKNLLSIFLPLIFLSSSINLLAMDILSIIKDDHLNEKARLSAVFIKGQNSLLVNDNKIYETNCNGQNALSLAILLNRSMDVINFLIKTGGNKMVDCRDKFDFTPLEIACIKERTEAVKSILSSGATFLKEDKEVFYDPFFKRIFMEYLNEFYEQQKAIKKSEKFFRRTSRVKNMIGKKHNKTSRKYKIKNQNNTFYTKINVINFL